MISSFLSLFRSSRPGETAECPLELKAVPGLTTVLDTALHRSVEAQLTSTITSAHALLAAWLDLKYQSQLVIQYIKQAECTTCSCSACSDSAATMLTTSTSSSTATTNAPPRLSRYESFARACLEASWEAVDRIATDRFAQTANLGPDVTNVNAATPATTTNSSSTTTTTTTTALTTSTATALYPYHHSSSIPAGSSGGISITTSTSANSAATESFLASMIESGQHDTGRRRHFYNNNNNSNINSPYFASARDCWESPRLHCLDAVYCDEVAQTCQRLLRHLLRHPYVVFVEVDATKALEQSNSRHNKQNQPTTTAQKNQKRVFLLDHHLDVLLQVLRRDLPVRLLRFRNAIEADALVLNRLYLIKAKYRVPLRAFLEAHQSVQRAPSLAAVKEYLEPTTSGKISSGIEQKPKEEKRSSGGATVVKERLLKLLETPELLRALSLEKACFEFELEMAKMLYPFCELARYLDQKHARINIHHLDQYNKSSDEDLLDIQLTLTRLKGLLCKKGGGSHDATSTGIRPLLLDLQGVPRDEQVAHTKNNHKFDSPSEPQQHQQIQERLSKLMEILKLLSRLCQEKQKAFRVERKSATSGGELDVPASIITGCKHFDDEMFSCRFLDWYDFVIEQKALASNDFEKLAGQLRREEMQLSLAGASMQSLQVIRQRLELISTDRQKRFEILNEIVQEICKTTELGGGRRPLHVRLICPEEDEWMILRPTSALGIFGIPLKLGGEPLPIG